MEILANIRWISPDNLISMSLINKPKRTHAVPVIVILSELSPAKLTISIVDELRNQKVDFRIVYLLKSSTENASIERLKLTTYDKTYGCQSKASIVCTFVMLSLFLMRCRPSVVYMSGRIASVVGTFCSVMIRTQFRIVTRHHGNENQILPSRAAYRLDQVVSALSTDIIAVSACASEQLSVEGVPNRKINIIPNGIDVNHCSIVREKRNELLMGNDVIQPLKIGVIARLTDWKGVQFTAEAFCLIREKYPEIRLQIIGAHSDAYPRISKILSTQPSSSYEFVPFDEDVISSFLNFSIFVHVPLETNSETFGLVYLEALATGTPAIFTKSGILNEVDPGDSAIMVKSRSSDSIKEAIDSILIGQTKISQMSLEFLSKNYSLARMSKEHVAFILKALSV